MKSISDILEQDSRERFERAQKNRIEDDWYYDAPLGGASTPPLPDPAEPAPLGFEWLLGADGQYLFGRDGLPLYGVAA